MKLLIAVLLLVLLSLHVRLWLGQGGYASLRELRQATAEQAQENARLETRNRALQAEVDDLREGQEAVEERARSEMGMIRDGEVFLHTIESEGDGP